MDAWTHSEKRKLFCDIAELRSQIAILSQKVTKMATSTQTGLEQLKAAEQQFDADIVANTQAQLDLIQQSQANFAALEAAIGSSGAAEDQAVQAEVAKFRNNLTTLERNSQQLIDAAKAVTGLSISTATLPDATVGQPYSFQVVATGGKPPYTFSADPSTALPDGLSIASDGTISGTPTTAGSSNVEVDVSDSSGAASVAAELPLTIAAAGAGAGTGTGTPAGQTAAGQVVQGPTSDAHLNVGNVRSPVTGPNAPAATSDLPPGSNLVGAGVAATPQPDAGVR